MKSCLHLEMVATSSHQKMFSGSFSPCRRSAKPRHHRRSNCGRQRCELPIDCCERRTQVDYSSEDGWRRRNCTSMCVRDFAQNNPLDNPAGNIDAHFPLSFLFSGYNRERTENGYSNLQFQFPLLIGTHTRNKTVLASGMSSTLSSRDFQLGTPSLP